MFSEINMVERRTLAMKYDTGIDVMTSKEAAEFLKISTNALRELCKKQLIPYVRVGNGHYRFSRESLTRWFQHNEQRNGRYCNF